jgi:hypothetical protein
MWGLPPSDTVLHVLSLVALAAQAMTAALAAGRRSMDWVGVCLLGCLGTIRCYGWKTHPISRSRQVRRSRPS